MINITILTSTILISILIFHLSPHAVSSKGGVESSCPEVPHSHTAPGPAPEWGTPHSRSQTHINTL